MSIINILHISDLHISSTPMRKEILDIKNWHDLHSAYERYGVGTAAASHDSRVMEALSFFALERKDFLDAIVLTGDIATEGISSDLIEALNFVDGEPRKNSFRTESGSPTLNISPELPIFLLPGNHDRYIPKGGLWDPGGNVFHEVFSSFWDDDARSFGIDKDDAFLGIVAGDFSLRSSGDSSKPQFLGSLAEGYVYDDVLKKMEAETERLRLNAREAQKKCVIVWAIHFPPQFEYKKSKWFSPVDTAMAKFKQLHNEDLLVSSAITNKVLLIMAGHTHEKAFYPDKTHSTLIACSGTTTQFYPDNNDGGNYCHIIRFEFGAERPLLSISDFRFNRKLGEFVAA